MAKRVRLPEQAVIPIAGWDDADNILRRIGELQGEIGSLEKKASEEINKLKADLMGGTSRLTERIDLFTRSLESFAAKCPDDFGKNKSRQLNFGIIGWRKSPAAVSITKKTLELIKKCLPKSVAAACIRTKESVDKESLAKLTEEQLDSVGARRESRDVFFVEPSKVESVSYEKNG